MKKKDFNYKVVVNILFTREDIEQIQAVAASHYDGKCQMFGKRTCQGWLFHFEDKPKDHVEEITVEWGELDTMAKILEQERYSGVKLSDTLGDIFKALRDEYYRVNAHWMMNDLGYTEVYRAELKRKYGDGKAVIPQVA